jgi:hypothetical protein
MIADSDFEQLACVRAYEQSCHTGMLREPDSIESASSVLSGALLGIKNMSMLF